MFGIDALLDIVSTIVILCVLFKTYYTLYDSGPKDIPLMAYYDDKFLIHFLNEFQLLLVNSRSSPFTHGSGGHCTVALNRLPQMLHDVEFCVTTLQVPSSLQTLWPEYMWLYVDHANWTAVPEVMLDMNINFLRLTNNQIQVVPPDLVTIPSLTFIILTGKPISILPEGLGKPATVIDVLYIDSTNISMLPSWLDASTTAIIAGDSPFCKSHSLPDACAPHASTADSRKQQRTKKFTVKLQPTRFRCVWLLIFVMHAFCAAYYVAVAALYQYLLHTAIVWTVVLYSLSIDISVYPVITAAHAVFAAGHLWGILKMVWNSVRCGQLEFDAGQTPTIKVNRPAARNAFLTWWARARRAWGSFFGRRGMFGIEGKLFELRIAAQETIEIVLQSCQCYRMSWLLATMWLQRLYAVMIVLNCWIGALIHFLSHRLSSGSHHVARTRVVLLVIDALLDIVSTIVIPCVLFQTYYINYDPERRDFPLTFYYDDNFLMNFLNEFQLLLVNGWTDLMMRCTFATSLLLSLESIKATLQRAIGAKAIVPTLTSAKSLQDVTASPPKGPSLGPTLPVHSKPVHGVAINAIHFMFVVWGCIVAYAQLHAQAIGESTNCIVAVHPWFRNKAGCALIELNGTHWSEDDDTKEAVADELAKFDEEVVSYLILRNHTGLHMPASIQKLSNLVGLKLDNISLVEWGEDAALTNTHHPRLMFLFLVRFNATAIPPGMLSTDFPKMLHDVEFCVTTLPELPPSLPSIWPPYMWLYVDHANWTEVPQVMLDMSLSFLRLAYNRIQVAPPELFTSESLSFVVLSGNPILSLPANLSKPSIDLQMLLVDSTYISELPSWIDMSITSVFAGGTPYCNNGTNHATSLTRGRLPVCSNDIDCRVLHHVL
ncbi:TPA: hypothetical protein N0F65_005456 [Lagenidium giganteum]|uniref:Leucine-rich repeat domain-containing protein n=1 Tax=Lagenidium giganteum TaxID=4803 RepID=A0AAV2YZP7_9STRA|nr:TPA: hypothetical protein N0F65_005456 [Lagenidium giganteum]